MAQHLRIGSRATYSTIYVNALITNITDAYLEFEYEDPTTLETVVRVQSWAAMSQSWIVVTD